MKERLVQAFRCCLRSSGLLSAVDWLQSLRKKANAVSSVFVERLEEAGAKEKSPPAAGGALNELRERPRSWALPPAPGLTLLRPQG